MNPVSIDIISDAVCPWCFVGKRQLERALAQLPEVRAEVRWRPYFLDPTVPPEGLDARQYLTDKFGHPQVAEQLQGRLSHVAADLGIAFDLAAQRRRPNTLDAHRLIHWAGQAGCQDAVVEALFRAYFEQGRDIGDRDELCALGRAAGMDPTTLRARLASDDAVAVVRQEASQTRDGGITSVPTFLIDGFMLPGAQEPALFVHVIRRALRRQRGREQPERAEP